VRACVVAVSAGTMTNKSLVAVVAMFLFGCSAATGPVRSGESRPEEAVALRAQARWDALKKGDFDAAYRMLSPASRDVMKIEAFRGRGAMATWKEAMVTDVTCQSHDVCKAAVEVRYLYRGRGGVQLENVQALSEDWANISGEWWYIPPELF